MRGRISSTRNIALRQKLAYLTREAESWKEPRGHDEIIDLWLRSVTESSDMCKDPCNMRKGTIKIENGAYFS